MHHFEYRAGQLCCETVTLETIAKTVGTPVYVYSSATLRRHYRVYMEAFAPLRANVAYAVKANGNLSVLATLTKLGAGADTVSEGEIRRALAAGIPPGKIIFSGMGKGRTELAFALQIPGIQINIESEPELEAVLELARAGGARPLIAIRVNPNVDAGAHEKISTGNAHDKFGVPLEEVERLYRSATGSGALEVVGLACHLGSQIVDIEPFARAWTRIRDLIGRLRAGDMKVERLDLGGGLGVPFEDGEHYLAPVELGALALELFGSTGLEISVEPGRAIVANAGVLLAKVIHVNRRADGRRFLVLDAGMNDLMRPALYGARHSVKPLIVPSGATLSYNVVGPVCESADVFSRDVLLPPQARGDLVALMTAGAYGASMASEYNSRLLVPEVLVDGGRFAVVRRRSSYAQLLAREPVASWLQPHALRQTR